MGRCLLQANTKYESTDADWVKEYCDEAAKSVKLAMFQMRLMGFSITPKLHGLECHLVHQMRTVPGGIAMLIEHWVEQYHQKAAEAEKLWAAHSYEIQAEFCACREQILNNPDTMKATAKIAESKRQVKRRRKESTVDKENRIKAGRVQVKQEVQAIMDSMALEEEAMNLDGNLGSS